MFYKNGDTICNEVELRKLIGALNISLPEEFKAEHVAEYGWIPFEQPAVILSPEEQVLKLQEDIVTRTQQRLDDFARTRNYDGILSAATYATSTILKFATEGQYAVQVRDLTWSKLYEIMAEVQAGTRPMPSGYVDIEPELPALTWPVT